VKCLVEEVFIGTLYEFRFADFFSKCRDILGAVRRDSTFIAVD